MPGYGAAESTAKGPSISPAAASAATVDAVSVVTPSFVDSVVVDGMSRFKGTADCMRMAVDPGAGRTSRCAEEWEAPRCDTKPLVEHGSSAAAAAAARVASLTNLIP